MNMSYTARWYTYSMKLSKLLLIIGVVFIGFWILNIIFKITFFLIHVALGVGMLLVVAALIQNYIESRKS
jgi:hypothetical protein